LATFKPLLILVVGLPAAGKTSLATRLATDLAMPKIGKDEIKELLFDSLGWKDREWSVQLGAATFELLYLFIERALAAKSSIIVDADFSSPERVAHKLNNMITKYPCRVVRIQLVCDGNVLLERFKRRSEDGTRHPGHVDHTNYEEFAPALLKGRRAPLDIGGRVIEVDTTNFESIPYDTLFSQIREEAR